MKGTVMEKNRVFTEKELKEMEVRTMDAAIDAVEAGDKDKAKELINRMYRETQGMHDVYLNWIAELMDYIYKNSGEEELYQSMRQVMEELARPFEGALDNLDYRSRVGVVAETLRGHGCALEIEEDDEKVSIKMRPCGSGQKLIDSGAYDPPRNLSRLKPHVMTWGQPDFPIYCIHNPVQSILAIEKTGYPMDAVFPAKDVATDSCRFDLYKDPDSIPEEVYTRVGMKKPNKP
jgi:hypothetical protein